MSNDHIKSEISLYLAGGLTESRNRQIEAHAIACEKCRNALAKARAKQARGKREALKKASDPLPNLFLARQGKDAGMDHERPKAPWLVVGVLAMSVGSYWVLRHSPLSSRFSVASTPAAEPAAPEAGVASVPAPEPAAAPVAVPTPAPPPPVPAPVQEKQPDPPKPTTEVSVQQQWRGDDSGKKNAKVVVVRTSDRWDQLRGEMAEGLPDIDFTKHIVVGVFAGEQTAGTSVSFGKMKEADDEVYAPYRINVATAAAVQVSTVSAAPAATPPAPTHPYVLSLIPRTEKRIHVFQKEAAQ